MEEIFKDVKGYEGLYKVSNLGRVKSLKRKTMRSNGRILPLQEKILKSCPDGKGYLSINLNKFKVIHIKVHHLVWDAYGSKQRNGMKLQVDHIDGNKQNNRINNLELVSNRENCSRHQKRNKSNKTSKYVGVCWVKRRNHYKAEIYVDGKRIYIGSFQTEIEASNAYQKILKTIQ